MISYSQSAFVIRNHKWARKRSILAQSITRIDRNLATQIFGEKIRKPLKISRSKILKRFSEISTPNFKVRSYRKKTAAVSQSPEDYMGAFWCKRKARKFSSRSEHLKSEKNENGRGYVMFANSNPTKMRISPIKLQGRMVVPRMVATSEKNVQLAFLNDQAKQLKSMV